MGSRKLRSKQSCRTFCFVIFCPEVPLLECFSRLFGGQFSPALIISYVFTTTLICIRARFSSVK